MSLQTILPALACKAVGMIFLCLLVTTNAKALP